MFTPTFNNPSSGIDIDIQQITLTDEDGTGSDVIQLVDEKGFYTGVFTWYNKDTADMFGSDWGFDGAGWYSSNDDGTVSKVTHPITLGTGIYLNVLPSPSTTAKVKVQCSGGVKLESYPINLSAGYNIVGNATPKSQSLQDFKLSANADGTGNDVIQLVDEKGFYTGVFTWYNKDTADMFGSDWGFDGAGWYSSNEDGTVSKATISVDAGEGLYVNVLQACEFELPSTL